MKPPTLRAPAQRPTQHSWVAKTQAMLDRLLEQWEVEAHRVFGGGELVLTWGSGWGWGVWGGGLF